MDTTLSELSVASETLIIKKDIISNSTESQTFFEFQLLFCYTQA